MAFSLGKRFFLALNQVSVLKHLMSYQHHLGPSYTFNFVFNSYNFFFSNIWFQLGDKRSLFNPSKRNLVKIVESLFGQC